MNCFLTMLLSLVGFLLLAVSPAGAQPARMTTGGAMLLGSWQNEASDMTLHCLADRTAILEIDVTGDDRTTRSALGSYRAVRQGMWELTVKDPDHKTHTFTLVFENTHRLLLQKGADKHLVFLRAGTRFSQLDRDHDGWITKAEAKGTPLQYRYDEFVSGKEKQVDRRGYERFLEKYPNLAALK
jgi:hypothetical protein